MQDLLKVPFRRTKEVRARSCLALCIPSLDLGMAFSGSESVSESESIFSQLLRRTSCPPGAAGAAASADPPKTDTAPDSQAEEPVFPVGTVKALCIIGAKNKESHFSKELVRSS